MRGYPRREFVGFREGFVEGDARGLVILDPPTSAPALVVAPAPMQTRTRARVTVGKLV